MLLWTLYRTVHCIRPESLNRVKYASDKVCLHVYALLEKQSMRRVSIKREKKRFQFTVSIGCNWNVKPSVSLGRGGNDIASPYTIETAPSTCFSISSRGNLNPVTVPVREYILCVRRRCVFDTRRPTWVIGRPGLITPLHGMCRTSTVFFRILKPTTPGARIPAWYPAHRLLAAVKTFSGHCIFRSFNFPLKFNFQTYRLSFRSHRARTGGELPILRRTIFESD